MTNLLELKGISETFPGVRAPSGVDLGLRPGRVLGLCGENGAGKSTLMKVLTGIHKSDPNGGIWLQGERIDIQSPEHARDLGLSIIHQELNTVPNLTVVQNLYIGRLGTLKFGYVGGRKMVRGARELFEHLNMDIDPTTHYRDLPVARLQMVEVAHALSFDSKILVMDEPAAPLATTEAESLFELVRDFACPTTGLIFVTHRMPESAELTDRISVLHDGKYIGTVDMATTPMSEVVKMMVGHEVPADVRPTTKPLSDEAILCVEHLSTVKVVHDVSFEVKKGEIFGFAGLVGTGRTEVARALFGAGPHVSGDIYVHGKRVSTKGANDAVKSGVDYPSEDRKQYGLLLDKDLSFNTGMTAMEHFTRGSVVATKKLREVAKNYVKELRMRTPSVDTEVRSLSGDNQQEAVVAKWLERDTDVLIFGEPTRGIDVGAKDRIYTLPEDLAKQGEAIIVISSELPEVLHLADRIAAMVRGHIIGTLGNEEATQRNITEPVTISQRGASGVHA